MLLIDVREDHEFEPGSIHSPLGQLQDRMSDIPRDIRLVFFRNGGARASRSTKVRRDLPPCRVASNYP